MSTVVTEKKLGALLRRKDLTIEELVKESEALLEALVPAQTRYKVRQRPDVRTIRYYINQNLLPKPVSYDGGRARYAGAHVLRLLAIKKLQSEHLTLGRIASELQGKSDDDIIDRLMTRPPRAFTPSADRRKAPTSRSAKRLELSPGGALEVPREVLDNPVRRNQLADNLEALAEWLRAGSTVEAE